MIRSMTAFARREGHSNAGQLIWELRSVNHRFAEISLRLPDDLRGLEPQIRAGISAVIRRGKVDASLRLKVESGEREDVVLDEHQTRSVLKACSAIEALMDNPDRVSPLDVLQWPGVLQPAEIDFSQIGADVMALLDEALEELCESRAREGAQIAELLRQRCQAIRDQLVLVRKHLPDILQAQRQRLQKRLEELSATLDTERLEQEVVLLAQKMDVDEELDRLDLHLTELERILSQSEPVGRRLDFLMQEFNREINTLASKSVAGVTSQAAVEMKVLVEQMREQIQNIE
jgi:uncharacterized protein (TIGR00255 family)